MPSIVCWPLLVVGLFIAIVNLRATTRPAKTGPTSVFATLVAKPKAVLAQPAYELIPHELIKIFGTKELGLELLEISRITVLVDEIVDPSMEKPPGLALIVEFDTPQKLGDPITSQMMPMTIAGKEAFSFPRDDVAILMLNEKTLLGGTTKFLGCMLSDEARDNAIIDKLKSAPQDDHVNIVIQIDSIRALIKQNLPPRSQVPPPFGEFMALPDLIKSISYRGSFSKNQIAELTIEANNEKDALKITRLVENALEWGKGAALTGIAAETEIDPDYEEALVVYADRLTEALKSGFKPKFDGNKLVYDLNQLQIAGGGNLNTTATIGVLVGMLLPAVQQVRQAARRTTSMNNLRQIGLAAHNYESAFRKLPLQANYDKNGKPLLSWRVHLLPFMEESVLYEQFNLDEPWDSENNIKLLDQMPACFKNPNFEDDTRTVYLAVAGPGTVFPGNKKVNFTDITDGTSNTAFFVEADADMAVQWTKPQDWEFDADDPLKGLGNLRPGGFSAAFCDGSTRFIDQNIDSETWFSMTQIADK